MTIHRLSESAVRAIGSCQTLTESSSLVKELIDNALDANATSITVELSANVLDVVQVKDNGRGFQQPRSNGHGLENMRARLKQAGGIFEYVSNSQTGTVVTFRLPLTSLSPREN